MTRIPALFYTCLVRDTPLPHAYLPLCARRDDMTCGAPTLPRTEPRGDLSRVRPVARLRPDVNEGPCVGLRSAVAGPGAVALRLSTLVLGLREVIIYVDGYCAKASPSVEACCLESSFKLQVQQHHGLERYTSVLLRLSATAVLIAQNSAFLGHSCELICHVSGN